MLAALIYVPLVVASTLCCEQSQFILEYADFYSISEITIVVNKEEVKEALDHPYVRYITYGSPNLRDALNIIRLMQDETELLVFIGSDHSDLLQLLDDETEIFHSEVKSIMVVHSGVHFNLRLDTNIIFCKAEGTSNELSEQYAIKKGAVITQHIGSWTSSSGLQITSPVLWERRSDLKKTQLIDTILRFGVVTRFSQNEEGDITDKEGIFQDLFFLLQSKLNFTSVVKSPPDGKWGDLNDDNLTWNGMIGELTKKNADISTAGLGRNFVRDKVVDYGITSISYRQTLIQASSTSVALQFWVYMKVFPLAAWIIILISILLFALLIYCLARYQKSISFANGVGISCVYLLQLSSDSVTDLKRNSSKLGIVTWALGCYLVFSYYEADLTANMTTRPAGSSIRSVIIYHYMFFFLQHCVFHIL